MCGIVGLFSPGKNPTEIESITSDMATTLLHRGPDAVGTWSGEGGIGFGHTRLSIIDLSKHGSQPMRLSCGRYTICFNGEIYNFPELRRVLQSRGTIFRGHSDTEVFIEYISALGLDNALTAARGMFAFGLWDSKTRSLTLARDRLGEKPLYYGIVGNDLVFSSELKSVYEHPEFLFSVNKSALSAYVKYSYVPTPLCILDGFKKLPAATCVSGTDPAAIMHATVTHYWKPLSTKVDNTTINGLESLLLETISSEMVSDVPIGCFLSGGIDSSLVTALMQANSETPIETFTIGFNEQKYNEAPHAEAVSTHLGTRHQEWIITQNDILDLIPSIPKIYDEPFADSSQLPTCLLSRMTSQSVTVCLSGDGGDELFCGYERYIWANKVNKYLSRAPSKIKKLYSNIYNRKTIEQWNTLYSKVERFSPRKFNDFGTKLDIINNYAEKRGADELYDSLISHWQQPGRIVRDAIDYSLVRNTFDDSLSFIENLMLNDSMHYLTDDIMVKVDRATMSASLESRAPLLDHKVFEYAWSMPLYEKYSNGVTKKPLREILYKYVPKEIIERPKMGFGVPLEDWFRHELKDWCEASLSTNALSTHGLFHIDPIRNTWKSHRDSSVNKQYHLWNILSFQEWYNYWSGVSISNRNRKQH
jgi:asparagine synthase (glutamine-hydrolysing)